MSLRGFPAAGSTGTWTYFIRYSGDANHPAKDGTRTAQGGEKQVWK